MLSPTRDLRATVLPVGKPFGRTVALCDARLSVARCHTEGWLAAALVGRARIVGFGGALVAQCLLYHLRGLVQSPLLGIDRLVPPWLIRLWL